MADNDDFVGLRSDGKKGVYFDSGAAQAMAQQAADMLSVVNAAFALVQPEQDLQPFNQRDSGLMLAKKFNEAVKRLGDTVAKSHQAVLTSMGEAFVGATKEYAEADHTSAVNFDANVANRFGGMHTGTGQNGLAVSPLAALRQHVDSVSLPGWGQSNGGNVYEWSGTSKDDYSNKLQHTDQVTELNKLKGGAGVSLDNKQVSPEPGSQYEWDDFHNHWQYIHDSTILSVLTNHAQDWKTASEYIKSQAATFSTANDQYLTGFQGDTTVGDKIWASDAAKQAQTGIKNYLTNVTSLTDSMDLMSANFAFAEGWLKKLQNFLPYKSISETTVTVAAGCTVVDMPISQSAVDEAMTEMRQAWDEWYGNGVRDSSGAVPIIPDPKDAVAVQPVKPGDPAAPGPGPGTTPQVPSSPSSPGSPVTPDIPKVDGPTQPTDTQPTNTKPSDTNPTTTDTSQTLQSLLSQASSVVQAGISAVEQGAEKIVSAVQQAVQTTQPTTTKDPGDPTTQPQDDLTKQLQNLGLIPNGSPSGSPSGLPTGGVPSSPGGPTTTEPKSQLFPRSAAPTTAADTETDSSTASRAGLATTSSTASTGTSGGMGGSPMAAGSQGGQGKEHKRPQYLTSLEHFEEVIGEAPAAVTPVAEK
ncbi:hypothetical protein ACIP5Y_43340 [Nocardia sp. NPDC088792]|uniref:hypothetical protein n=1 Tax=Nocardia sp. NPDC088792 TaxID=3364332 RepID=UPI0038237E29